MQVVKALVIGLGVLLVGGVALLVYGISQKASNPQYRMFHSTSPASAPLAAFGEARIPLPADCSVVEMKPDGPHIYLRIGPAGPCERIIIIDTQTGQTTGSIWLRP